MNKKEIFERMFCVFASAFLVFGIFFKDETAGSKVFWVSVICSIVEIALEQWRIYLGRKTRNRNKVGFC